MEQINTSPISGLPVHNNSSTSSSHNHLNSTDNKTKSAASKAFDWLWRNKMDLAVAVLSVTAIVVTVPLIATGVVLLPEALPVILIASLFFGASIFDITFNAIREHKINTRCKNLEQMIKKLEVYRDKMPTAKEIEEASNLQDLIDITEKWVDANAELSKALKDTKTKYVATIVENDISNLKIENNILTSDLVKMKDQAEKTDDVTQRVKEYHAGCLKNYLTITVKPRINQKIVGLRDHVNILHSKI